ncbi:hypothetical protein Maeo_1240 [Methanococcus aeolicus Nankai-3]|uniref:Uncharacterized protein n=1 Tax=Methanococcus aeolicus (strain ATCC BAA-1280 / DSM 17508 / OCM 812 / Nankai-3) TaxID=419665 RepID=A6UWE4_META3|nr:hypothetical protein [Methanococcus aeolicus]ABR56816.1 hypothetical protein Maeo_1240 [Methanococcus aeolicus Nankai-3]
MAETIGTINTKGQSGEIVISVPNDLWDNKNIYSIGADISGDDYQNGVRVQCIYNRRWTDISDRTTRCDRLENLNNTGKIRLNITKEYSNTVRVYWIKEEVQEEDR